MTSAMPADRNLADPSVPGSPGPAGPSADRANQHVDRSIPKTDHVSERADHPNRTADPSIPNVEPESPETADSAPGDVAPVRDGRSPKDMAVSLLVLLVPLLLVIGVYRVFLDGDQPVVIDSAPAVAEAKAANLFPVAEPSGLDPDWRTVTATFRRAEAGATLRLGYVSPAGGGVQLVQSSVPAEQLLPNELGRGGRPEGASPIDGRDWQRYPARPGERALVLLEPGRTVIAVGAVSESELRELVDSLG